MAMHASTRTMGRRVQHHTERETHALIGLKVIAEMVMIANFHTMLKKEVVQRDLPRDPFSTRMKVLGAAATAAATAAAATTAAATFDIRQQDQIAMQCLS